MEETSYPQRIKDPDLIGEEIKLEIEKLTQKSNKDMEKIIDEAFSKGIAYYVLKPEKIGEVNSEKLVDDSFSYTSWQLNLYPYINTQNSDDVYWAEVKTAILRKGLERMDI